MRLTMIMLLAALAGVPGPAAAAPDASPLSLAERRGIQAYQSGSFPGLLQRIHAAAGFEVPVDVTWPAIAIRGEAARYSEPPFWTDIYFVPLADALGRVGADAMGKQALRERLKSIVVTYDKDTAPATAYENGVTFAGGVLTLNFHPNSNVRDVTERADAIVKRLEAGL